eukprot:gene16397-25133_t
MESRPEEGLLKEQQEREFQEACEMYDIDGNGTVPLSSISCVLGSLGLCLADSMIAQFREKKAEEGESEVSYSELQHLVDKMQTIEDAQAAASKSKAAELENIFHLWDPSGAGIVKSSDASTNALSKALSEVMPVADVDAMLTKPMMTTHRADIAAARASAAPRAMHHVKTGLRAGVMSETESVLRSLNWWREEVRRQVQLCAADEEDRFSDLQRVGRSLRLDVPPVCVPRDRRQASHVWDDAVESPLRQFRRAQSPNGTPQHPVQHGGAASVVESRGAYHHRGVPRSPREVTVHQSEHGGQTTGDAAMGNLVELSRKLARSIALKAREQGKSIDDVKRDLMALHDQQAAAHGGHGHRPSIPPPAQYRNQQARQARERGSANPADAPPADEAAHTSPSSFDGIVSPPSVSPSHSTQPEAGDQGARPSQPCPVSPEAAGEDPNATHSEKSWSDDASPADPAPPEEGGGGAPQPAAGAPHRQRHGAAAPAAAGAATGGKSYRSGLSSFPRPADRVGDPSGQHQHRAPPTQERREQRSYQAAGSPRSASGYPHPAPGPYHANPQQQEYHPPYPGGATGPRAPHYSGAPAAPHYASNSPPGAPNMRQHHHHLQQQQQQYIDPRAYHGQRPEQYACRSALQYGGAGSGGSGPVQGRTLSPGRGWGAGEDDVLHGYYEGKWGAERAKNAERKAAAASLARKAAGDEWRASMRDPKADQRQLMEAVEGWRESMGADGNGGGPPFDPRMIPDAFFAGVGRQGHPGRDWQRNGTASDPAFFTGVLDRQGRSGALAGDWHTADPRAPLEGGPGRDGRGNGTVAEVALRPGVGGGQGFGGNGAAASPREALELLKRGEREVALRKRALAQAAANSKAVHRATLTAVLRKHAPKAVLYGGVDGLAMKWQGNENELFSAILRRYRADPPGEPWKALYTAFYHVFNPAKLAEVDAILQLATGREDAVFEQMKRKYAAREPPFDSIAGIFAAHAAKDASVAAVCAVLSAAAAGDRPSTRTESILPPRLAPEQQHPSPSPPPAYASPPPGVSRTASALRKSASDGVSAKPEDLHRDSAASQPGVSVGRKASGKKNKGPPGPPPAKPNDLRRDSAGSQSGAVPAGRKASEVDNGALGVDQGEAEGGAGKVGRGGSASGSSSSGTSGGRSRSSSRQKSAGEHLASPSTAPPSPPSPSPNRASAYELLRAYKNTAYFDVMKDAQVDVATRHMTRSCLAAREDDAATFGGDEEAASRQLAATNRLKEKLQGENESLRKEMADNRRKIQALQQLAGPLVDRVVYERGCAPTVLPGTRRVTPSVNTIGIRGHLRYPVLSCDEFRAEPEKPKLNVRRVSLT